MLRNSLLAASLCGGALGGAVWPQPASIALGPKCLVLQPNTQFLPIGQVSDILTQGIMRYSRISFLRIPPVQAPTCMSTSPATQITINVTSPSLDLDLKTDETYSLAIADEGAATIALSAVTVYGALRGLETLSQMIDYSPSMNAWLLPVGSVVDRPAFQHRAVLLDTARHFIPLTSIYAFLDAMAYNKLNTFHWHIVDDQSFPYVSTTFPGLANNGSWGAPDPALVASHTYSPADVQSVITYARYRGIRTMPEFDTPGHSNSWGKSQPGLLTQCYDANGQPIPDSFGPIDPPNAVKYDFLQSLFKEVSGVFPDQYVHLGGDEVSYTCWQSNPNINAWMKANGIATYQDLEGYYVQKVLDLVKGLGKSYMAWQEVFDNGLKLAADTVVAVWKYHNTGEPQPPRLDATPTWQGELYNVTKAGFQAVVSSPWYLNYIAYGEDWPQYLTADLLDFNGTAAQQALVMGGEVCMWGEYVDATNVNSRTWPRGSAVAEALWTHPGKNANITDAQNRLNEHRCRLLNRGIEAEPPNGPFYCPQEWAITYNPPWAQ